MDDIEYGGSWTHAKLDILKRYLNAYTTALKDQPFRLTYVDAFAGSGFWTPRSADYLEDAAKFREMWKGSAAIALDVDNRTFDRLVFIEKDEERCRSLRQLDRDHEGRYIKVMEKDANEAIPRFCRTMQYNDRAVVFLDPFATQVSWNTVVTLAGTKKVDCWILFPLSAISRMMPTKREPDAELAAQLDRVFGDQRWRDLYHKPDQLPLFNEERRERSGGSNQIIALYREMLDSVFEKVAPTTRDLCNSKNAPIFTLFFAASNKVGADPAVRIADHILKRW